ncbi:MAG: hypothetical protein AAGA38_08265 [Pseudomonadota bacterium]
MTLDTDDLRAAVAAGMISEAQAASVLALAQNRADHRSAIPRNEEPFELFKGFNEIFIVVGLSILYFGWLGVTGLQNLQINRLADNSAFGFGLYALLGAFWVAIAARYFTLKRRMIAPSIALTLMFAVSIIQVGLSISWDLGLNFSQRATVTCALTTAALGVWYLIFRIPFSMALFGLGSFATVGAVFVLQGARVPRPEDLFLLSASGPFAWITIVMGLIGFAGAMAFDMSDPHRVSRRSASGFWLHLIAAPAIVNTVALTLLEHDGAANQALLLGFLLLMALVAVIIDRRSFLVAGVGYVVALSTIVLDQGAAIAILLLGLCLVLLGAQWETLRRRVMLALPNFAGKNRLPPYDLLTRDQS